MSDTSSLSELPVAETPAAIRFEDFGLSPDILRALSEQGYVHPTPIQVQAIPIVLQGRDVMGAAQTGTGKTAGFALPIIQLLLAHASSSASPARHPVRALILTPTRELADQVADNVKMYARFTPLRSTVVFGGVDMNAQTAILRGGVEIVIATPGRLLDHVQQKTVNLSQTQILVMDEADRMLDMGFLPDLQRIINLLPKKRQNLLFSATFSAEIKKLAASFQNNPLIIEVARSNAAAENVTQTIYKIAEDTKSEAISFLIRQRNLKQVIVFSNTKIGASKLARHLENEGMKASAIHGDKTQGERMAALEAFKQGQIEVLVATDVAARGLDIAELPCVINMDLPYNAEDYVHRIGRTGRAGASGDAISLYSDKDERLLVDIEKLIKHQFVRAELTGFVAKPSRSSGNSGSSSSHASTGSASAARPSSERPPRVETAPSTQIGERSSYGKAPSSAAGRRDKVDPWFSQPYEPSTPAPEKSTLVPAAGTSAAAKAPKRKMAALLGGQPKNL
ncbi:DEAD/DEAH box helicase [Herbaspirillum sp. RTI4]|uniref:DEAD/DEAH box helicase n=1 Tax=Herbaspirillum sp. RTI4 TaxID=3048640 RepID=UPI002AB4B31B|nr:DEAD/DEAH box helicase [Herbaspirillum sp. RTI4]MDY7580027.1 DEAD/DEAH box helicase [Herbaspirillum sp. RTI4]MEA9982990.1 DEAD/DEAH box helicase [Herbaspirillum sp. RTI4]